MRVYPKIDFYFGGLYQGSTTRFPSMMSARLAFSASTRIRLEDLVAKYAENGDTYTYYRKSN